MLNFQIHTLKNCMKYIFRLHTLSSRNRLRLLGQLITISQIFSTKRLEDLFILYLQINPPLATILLFNVQHRVGTVVTIISKCTVF
jgi:hypothetical protein